MRIGARDRAVIRCFPRRQACVGHKLTTDGTRLDGLWLGGSDIAHWSGGRVVMPDLGSRAAQTVQRALGRALQENARRLSRASKRSSRRG
jgi:hypothetical protein